MVAALAGRFAAAIATLFGATGLLLALLVLAPGDPLGDLPVNSETRLQLQQQWGLDRPAVIRWSVYMSRIVTLDFGTSWVYRPGAPSLEVIARPAGRTLLLVSSAALLAATWGTILALLTGGRSSRSRVATQSISLIPTFLLAYATVTALNAVAWWAIGEGWIDRPSWFALPDEPSLLRSVLAVVVLAVGSGTLSEIHGELEDAIVALRRAPWIDAARARGQSTAPLVLRGLAPDLVATMANRAARLVGGAVVVEKLLLLNGAGAILWEAASLRDYELALSIGVLAAAVVASSRLLADALRIVLVPRLRDGVRR